MAINIDVDFVVVADNQFIILNSRATLDLVEPPVVCQRVIMCKVRS